MSISISATVKDKVGTSVTAVTTASISSSAFPDASNTGVPAGTTLTNSGGIVVSTAGAVIQNLKIVGGQIRVTAPNVTIKNCYVDVAGKFYHCVDASSTSGLLLEDCTLLNSVPGLNGQNLQCSGSKVLRCNMSGMTHCIASDGGNLYQDNYMHGLNGPTDGHYECIYIGGGGAGDTIKHNTMVSFDTAVVFMKTDYGAVNNCIVDSNQMLQQTPIPVSGLHSTSYTIYLLSANGSGNQITNNVMQKGFYGYTSITDPNVVWKNNTDFVTGAQIVLGS